MKIDKAIISDIKNILDTARSNAYAAVNFAMVYAYWNVGRRIVLEEQKGTHRAEYGTALITELSKQLTKKLGKGFSEVNLKAFRKFYLIFSEQGKRQTVSALLPGNKKGHLVSVQSDKKNPTGNKSLNKNISAKKRQTTSALSKRQIQQTLSAELRRELRWSHYQLIMRVENERARQYYINEAADNNWSVRVLQRNINTFYYERILSTKNKKQALIKSKDFEKQSPADFIKDPYIFEFLKIPQPAVLNERDIETALIDNLQHFLLELGKGFCFVSRQYHIKTETKFFSIDLVFYNYILKCFALFDLKTGKLTHDDIGQMDMYIRMFDNRIRTKSDNPTIGVILCSDKDETIVKYSMLDGNKKMFATKYRMYLPTEKELAAEIEREKSAIEEKIKSQNKNDTTKKKPHIKSK